MLAVRPFFSVFVPCKLHQWPDPSLFQIATHNYSLGSEFVRVSVTFVQNVLSLFILLSQVKPKLGPVVAFKYCSCIWSYSAITKQK